MKVICGTSNPELSKEIVEYLKINPTNILIKKFADGEIYARLKEDIRGEDVFIVQSTNSNDNLMELLIMIDAAKRASAKRITAIIPYYGYGRQDRKAEAREPITAKLVANLITVAGTDRVLTIDLHSPQIQGFFDIPLDDTWAFPIFVRYFQKKSIKNLTIVSPDAGGVKRALHLSKRLNALIAMIDKRRTEHNKIEEMKVIGDVKGKNAIIYDDIIDTGGTICTAATALKKAGAKNVYICAVHPVFSGNAVEKLIASDAKEILVTNSIPTKKTKKIKVLDMSYILAIAIKNIHESRSISTLDKQILRKKKIKWTKRK
ncbi:MAG: ribose-phosphate pyrophosphokinase [Nanoarchaeota archaeon]|nr:ribose-phosphate pyrophosphokinase [DPANN group archaeon]MBL7117126.1 ribose-phosphate pyrophosphokinase [Nanoarchaeota archaeon]